MNFRLGTPFGSLPATVAAVNPVIERGHSGYFSTPQNTLDPHLFNGDKVLDNVRQYCIETLLHYLSRRYKSPARWTTVWLAGSGISYQWAGDRGNGDLDVLYGVSWPTFFELNPDYQGFSEAEMVTIINGQAKDELWPTTANHNFNGQTYEVTFYVNQDSSDIRDINPYAAYDLTSNTWTVRPVNYRPAHFPKSFYASAEAEANQAKQLISRYKAQRSVHSVNDLSAIRQTVGEAKNLFDSIHLGRHNAFGPGGSGYGDFYNFRWQYHKQAGTVQALAEIAKAEKESQKQDETKLYGRPIDDAQTALIKAAWWNRGRNEL